VGIDRKGKRTYSMKNYGLERHKGCWKGVLWLLQWSWKL